MTQCIKRTIAGSLLLMAVMSSIQGAETTDVTIINPIRAFGYTLGDVLEQRVSLQHGDATHAIQQLPVVQREGRWVTRSFVMVSADNQWLDLRYQIINAPLDTRIVSLPALTLSTDAGINIEVPAWSFSIAPLIPTGAVQDSPLPTMQPDWRPQAPASVKIVHRMKLLAASLCTVLLLWFAWWLWRGWREAKSLPFARAWHAQRKNSLPNREDNATSWLAIHRAFDQAAGRSVSSGTLDSLVQRVDWLEPFRPDIHAFYRQSSKRFFAPDSQHNDINLHDFSKRLYLAEKRNTQTLTTASDRADYMP